MSSYSKLKKRLRSGSKMDLMAKGVKKALKGRDKRDVPPEPKGEDPEDNEMSYAERIAHGLKEFRKKRVRRKK